MSGTDTELVLQHAKACQRPHMYQGYVVVPGKSHKEQGVLLREFGRIL